MTSEPLAKPSPRRNWRTFALLLLWTLVVGMLLFAALPGPVAPLRVP